MKKTLEQMLKEPHTVGIADIAEFVCTGYDKDIFQVIRLLEAYAESIDKEHKRDIAAKDSEIRHLEAKIRRLTT